MNIKISEYVTIKRKDNFLIFIPEDSLHYKFNQYTRVVRHFLVSTLGPILFEEFPNARSIDYSLTGMFYNEEEDYYQKKTLFYTMSLPIRTEILLNELLDKCLIPEPGWTLTHVGQLRFCDSTEMDSIKEEEVDEICDEFEEM